MFLAELEHTGQYSDQEQGLRGEIGREWEDQIKCWTEWNKGESFCEAEYSYNQIFSYDRAEQAYDI